MTGSWDKTLKVFLDFVFLLKYIYKIYIIYLFIFIRFQFWDTRTPHPMMTINLNERVYCADVVQFN